jgi:Flp pilus assembly protein TadG
MDIAEDIPSAITFLRGGPYAQLAALFRRLASEQASNLIEVSIVLPLLLIMLAGVVDLGRAIYYSQALASAASAGAIYGSQAPTDLTGMKNTVDDDASTVPGISAKASYGCECQNGTDKSASCSTDPSCSDGVVYYVTVTASSDFKPIMPWPGIPSSLTLSSSSTMRGDE